MNKNFLLKRGKDGKLIYPDISKFKSPREACSLFEPKITKRTKLVPVCWSTISIGKSRFKIKNFGYKQMNFFCGLLPTMEWKHLFFICRFYYHEKTDTLYYRQSYFSLKTYKDL